MFLIHPWLFGITVKDAIILLSFTFITLLHSLIVFLKFTVNGPLNYRIRTNISFLKYNTHRQRTPMMNGDCIRRYKQLMPAIKIVEIRKSVRCVTTRETNNHFHWESHHYSHGDRSNILFYSSFLLLFWPCWLNKNAIM